MERKRLGKGLEDISHFFISQDQRKIASDSIALEESSKRHILSIVDLFNPQRGALFASKIAAEFCRNGLRTLLVDADPRFPSVAFIMGFSKPGYSLRHYLQEDYKLADILYTGPFGLKLLAPHLDIKDNSGLDRDPVSQILEFLASIEDGTDIIILRQYKKEFLSFPEYALFFVPVYHAGMIMVYRQIKAFVSEGDKKNVGLIVTDALNKDMGESVYENIAACMEKHCGVRPFLYSFLPDVSSHSIAAAVEGMVRSIHIQRDKVKEKESFFGRVRCQMTNNNLTGEEVSILIGKP